MNTFGAASVSRDDRPTAKWAGGGDRPIPRKATIDYGGVSQNRFANTGKRGDTIEEGSRYDFELDSDIMNVAESVLNS